MVEKLKIRCPRLGGEVTFAYCRQEGGELPCARIVSCWQAFFDVEAYFKERLTPQQWEDCFGGGPKDKISALLELIEEAKRGKGKDG
ncbi:MAG: hypothetical protein AB2L11_07540 [Syntrophobacteraceae bacterium]